MISVIVPIYKVEAYLPYCLDSLLNNSYKDVEVICVNDGSPDSCAEILKRYAQADSRVKVINKSNGGVASARNVGLNEAKGEWIAFVDADDAVHFRYFEALLEAWETDKKKADAVICWNIWHEQGELPDFRLPEDKHNVPQALNWDQMRKQMQCYAFMWGKIYRRELIGNERIPEHLRFAEDTYFNLKVLSKASNVRIINAPSAKYFYRTNGASICHTLSKDCMYDASVMLINASRIFPSKGGRGVASEAAIRNLFNISLSTENKELKSLSRKHIKIALNIWMRAGFTSKENFIMWVKFCLYYLVPPLETVGRKIHQYRNH